MLFRDRVDAGRQLAQRLTPYAGRDDVLVLALPRGGVPVAAEIAAALDAPFDVFLVRKLGVPGQPELAMGAIAEGGTTVLNDDLIDSLGTSVEMVERVRARELQELERRQRLYRGVRPRPDVHDRTVILVDDGLATGASMEAAVGALRAMGPARVVVAVPVGARESCARMAALADEVICAQMPEYFAAVGQWYADFSETSDEEVSALLSGA
jgi:predicted phosphoribosyltransferase